MKSKMQMWNVISLLGVMLFYLSGIACAEEGILIPGGAGGATVSLPEKKEVVDYFASDTASLPFSRRFIHRLSVEVRPGYIFTTNSFLRGENMYRKPIKHTFSSHLNYSFQFRPNTCADRIYGGAYQGAGLAYYTFGDRKEIGNPVAFYLLQGARITRFTSYLSLNYEWNFGFSVGWKPYDYRKNNYNKVIGSSTNAYINTNFYLNWRLFRHLDLMTGVTLSHFSNGNTRIPNAGLNTVDLKIGLVYNMNRKEDLLGKSLFKPFVPKFPRHISYDLVLFGSWRRKGVIFGDKQVASPEAYTVFGFNFNPMYNIGYKFRIGLSLDGVYDGSANVFTEDYIVGTTQEFYKPPLHQQLALGISGRAEYVMPYFTIGIGVGGNVLHGKGDLKAFYQILALKIAVIRSSFVHVGYSIHDFSTPNFLMLGVGYRFNNKYPKVIQR